MTWDARELYFLVEASGTTSGLFPYTQWRADLPKNQMRALLAETEVRGSSFFLELVRW